MANMTQEDIAMLRELNNKYLQNPRGAKLPPGRQRDRLRRLGYIESWRHPLWNSGHRPMYRLTPAGLAALAALEGEKG